MRKRSFTSQGIRRLKGIVGIIGGIVIFQLIVSVLNYLYVSPVDADWERILLHNYYKDQGKIDNLYLGSSHVYCDINPAILDEANGQYNFNFSTPRQQLNASYIFLKETDRNNDLSHVYLELYYRYNVIDLDEKESMDTEFLKNCRIRDFMKNSLAKTEFTFSIAGVDKYADIFLPFSRYRIKLDDWNGYVKDIINRKKDEDYLAYKYASKVGNGYVEFREQGYRYTTQTYTDSQRRYHQIRVLRENPMGEKAEAYLRKIISYCQEREIPITLFISPIDGLEVVSTEHYDHYLNQVREIAQEYDVPLYDFNLTKEEYLPIQHGEYFRDEGHLNATGASMFTPFFYEVVTGEVSENAKYFHDSYEEKLMSEVPRIYGIYYRDFEQEDEYGELKRFETYWIAANRDTGMEYKIIMMPDEGEQYTIQDFSENRKFTVLKEESGTCTVIARMTDGTGDVQELKIAY